MYFRLFLDGAEKKGINTDSLEKELERDIVERGFLTKYSREVIFFSDAYEYLIDLVRLNPCGEVEILIQARCSSADLWSDYIAGTLLLRDFKIDEQRCIIRTNIEDTSIFGIFFELKSFQVNLEETETLNGVASLTSSRRPIRNFFDSSGALIAATSGVDFAYGYPIFDALDFIVEFITDGRMTVESDFLTSGFTEHVIEIDFATTPVLNEVVVIQIEDFMGNIAIAQVTSDGNTANFAARMKAAILLNYPTSQVGVSNVSAATPGGGQIVFTLKSFERAVEVVSITTTGATVITDSVAQAYVRNANNINVSNGKLMSNQILDPFLFSFDDLFKIIASAHDLSYAIQKSGDDYILKIEPIEFFFENSVTLTLNHVPNVKTEYIEDRVRSSISVGRGDGNSAGFYRTWQFQTLNCGGTLTSPLLEDNVRFLYAEIFDILNGGTDYEDDIFLIKCQGLGGGFDEPEQYIRMEIPTPAAPTVVTTTYLYNEGLDINNRVQDVIFFAPDAINTGPQLMSDIYNAAGAHSSSDVARTGVYIGEPLKFIKRVSFEFPIGFSDFIAMDALSIIRFNTKGGFNRDGYIEYLKYKSKTGMAEVRLLEK